MFSIANLQHVLSDAVALFERTAGNGAVSDNLRSLAAHMVRTCPMEEDVRCFLAGETGPSVCASALWLAQARRLLVGMAFRRLQVPDRLHEQALTIEAGFPAVYRVAGPRQRKSWTAVFVDDMRAIRERKAFISASGRYRSPFMGRYLLASDPLTSHVS